MQSNPAEEIMIGGLTMKFGPKSGQYFRRMHLPDAPWRREFEFYPGSVPCLSARQEPFGTERNGCGGFVVPVTAEVLVAELSVEQRNSWWKRIQRQPSIWTAELTGGLVESFSAEIARLRPFLSEFRSAESLVSFENTVGCRDLIVDLVLKTSALKRIHLISRGSVLIVVYGFSCSWSEDHEVNLVFQDDKILRHEQGK
jgi:hypothetical protein